MTWAITFNFIKMMKIIKQIETNGQETALTWIDKATNMQRLCIFPISPCSDKSKSGSFTWATLGASQMLTGSICYSGAIFWLMEDSEKKINIDAVFDRIALWKYFTTLSTRGQHGPNSARVMWSWEINGDHLGLDCPLKSGTGRKTNNEKSVTEEILEINLGE